MPLSISPRLSRLLPRFGSRDQSALPADVSHAMIGQAREGVLVADLRLPDARLIYVNEAFERITGYSREEAVGKNCRYLQGGDRLQPEIAAIREALVNGDAIQVRLRNYRKNGTLFWNDLRLVPIASGSLAPTHYVGYIRDVTGSVEAAAALEELAHLDHLTGCLNRDAFVAQLASNTPSRHVLVLKLDIARFHEINCGYGHDVGDALLRAVALRLSGLGADLVGRIGNDQFVLAFTISDDFEVNDIVERVTSALSTQFVLPAADVHVRFAMGFVTGQPCAEPLTLMRQAGAALSDSKTSPLRLPREFVPARQTIAHERVRMTAELQRAISSRAFIYHFQPQIELERGEIVGAEALVRWRHPLFGLQQPNRFLALAEETGLILDIGASGLRDVIEFAVSFNRTRKNPLGFSFNVSSIEITHRDMVSLVQDILVTSRADPSWLTLELTESLLAEDSPEMPNIFHRLRDLGVGLSIDDFGTGYSSLRYLERFPLTEIKIDRSFVAGLSHSAAKRVIVESVIKLGRELGARIVGEGVETTTERDLLYAMGCGFAQGYLFSPPVTADALKDLVG